MNPSNQQYTLVLSQIDVAGYSPELSHYSFVFWYIFFVARHICVATLIREASWWSGLSFARSTSPFTTIWDRSHRSQGNQQVLGQLGGRGRKRAVAGQMNWLNFSGMNTLDEFFLSLAIAIGVLTSHKRRKKELLGWILACSFWLPL